MLQNLPYLWKKKTHVVFFVFHLGQVDQKPFISQECQAVYIKNEWFLGQFGFINHSFAQLTVHRRLTQTLQTE